MSGNSYSASVAVATALDVAALNAFKYAAVHKDSPETYKQARAGGTLLGAAAYYNAGNAVEASGVAVANTTWNVASTTTNAVVGHLYWGEKLSQRNWAGVALAVLGLWLLNSD